MDKCKGFFSKRKANYETYHQNIIEQSAIEILQSQGWELDNSIVIIYIDPIGNTLYLNLKKESEAKQLPTIHSKI